MPKKSDASGKKAQEKKRAKHSKARREGPRPFWSGTLSFGLVSLPVGLFPANRSKAVALHMVDENGTRLVRRYFCSKDDQPLDSDDLVRGYPVGDDRYVTIDDDELEALAPEKSQEIDLKRFVAVEQLDPMRFERAYFLTPEKGAIKAYRLLARSMESTGRAGIATFVMRGKEYLVAILSQSGILRAETLRFEDELRSPEDIGLPAPASPKAKLVQRFQAAIKPLMKDTLEREALRDRYSQALIERARKKLSTGRDVIESQADEDEDNENRPTESVDLMAVLKRSLREGYAADMKKESTSTPRKKAARRARQGSKKDNQLKGLSKDELYSRAQARGIDGRSSMNKAELIRALASAE